MFHWNNVLRKTHEILSPILYERAKSLFLELLVNPFKYQHDELCPFQFFQLNRIFFVHYFQICVVRDKYFPHKQKRWSILIIYKDTSLSFAKMAHEEVQEQTRGVVLSE